MSIQIENLKELEIIVNEAIAKTLLEPESQVKLVASIEIAEITEHMVYERYEPKKYKRRGDKGGLRDPEQVAILGVELFPAKGVKATLAQTAEGNFSGKLHSDDLASDINDGYGDKTQPWNMPSMHLDYLQQELIGSHNEADFFEAVKFDLSRFGLEIR